MAKSTLKPQRKFLGKTENFKDKEEKRFYQKMLNAYLKGNVRFRHGFETVRNELGALIRRPKYYDVLQQYL